LSFSRSDGIILSLRGRDALTTAGGTPALQLFQETFYFFELGELLFFRLKFR